MTRTFPKLLGYEIMHRNAAKGPWNYRGIPGILGKPRDVLQQIGRQNPDARDIDESHGVFRRMEAADSWAEKINE